MGLLSEFRDFAMRGNVVDMAVGIIIGAAFGDIVKSMVDDVLMPAIGALTAGVDFSSLSVKIPVPDLAGMASGAADIVGAGSQPAGAAPVTAVAQKMVKFVELKYGILINAIIKFTIVAFALFMIIKGMNKLKKKAEAAPPPPPPPSEAYLKEIRDLLAKRA
ncbi:MAG: large conductance mechanosensitive channel protein MscL [Phycisphaerae bacterium]|nr:large conductance mechanosensitive channel protein MscL [Phycisphaerae bacterium]